MSDIRNTIIYGAKLPDNINELVKNNGPMIFDVFYNKHDEVISMEEHLASLIPGLEILYETQSDICQEVTNIAIGIVLQHVKDRIIDFDALNNKSVTQTKPLFTDEIKQQIEDIIRACLDNCEDIDECKNFTLQFNVIIQTDIEN
jgi:ppGpp synthetase/RelA/SpoT-type nucleotidyltranferase